MYGICYGTQGHLGLGNGFQRNAPIARRLLDRQHILEGLESFFGVISSKIYKNTRQSREIQQKRITAANFSTPQRWTIETSVFPNVQIDSQRNARNIQESHLWPRNNGSQPEQRDRPHQQPLPCFQHRCRTAYRRRRNHSCWALGFIRGLGGLEIPSKATGQSFSAVLHRKRLAAIIGQSLAKAVENEIEHRLFRYL